MHWHDLAFFDPVLYESLRQLVADSQSWGDDVLEAVDLTFMVDLQNEEGGGQVGDLFNNARNLFSESFNMFSGGFDTRWRFAFGHKEQLNGLHPSLRPLSNDWML